MDHCAFNVALYARRGSRWAMTERSAARVSRENSRLAIGPSSMRWTGDALEIRIDEICMPVPHRVRGTIRVLPTSMFERRFALDPGGRHWWTPHAPCARIEASFDRPGVKWSGTGYFDANCGEEPLEDAFTDWTWSRAGAADRTVLYDVNTRAGLSGAAQARSLALRFAARTGEIEEIVAPPRVDLPISGWRVARQTRADAGSAARVVRTLEDAPFYSRAVLDTRLLGVRTPAIHESLNLDRFRAPWVQCLLPFRMPRVR